MPKAPLLDDAEIRRRLGALPSWTFADGRLVRVVRCRDFRDAVEAVVRIVDTADEQNHHPDVAIHWYTLTLSLWTHASGGITERDLRLAEAIEPILSTAEMEALSDR